MMRKIRLSLPACVLCGLFLLLAACNRSSPASETHGKSGDTNITIRYSRPSVKGRTIWGELVPYGELWRTGANEATTFTVDNDVTINGELLPAGSYALFTIPEEQQWTVIFNKNPGQWDTRDYEQSQDALRITARPQQSPQTTEMLTFTISDEGIVSLLWADLQLSFNVEESGNTTI